MNSSMMRPGEPRLFRVLFGARESVPLEKRVFNAVACTTGLLTSLLLLEAVVFGYANALVLTSVASAAFWGVYAGARCALSRSWPLVVYFFALGCVILADWFFVGGTSGLAMLVLVAISGTIPLVTSKTQMRVSLAFLAAVFAGTLGLTTRYWFLIPVSPATREAALIQILEAAVLSALLFSVAYLAIASYRHEKSLSSALNESLSIKNRQLEVALQEIEVLRGILPSCSYCGKIRPDNMAPREVRSWTPLEEFVSKHSGAKFSHGVCPDCVKEHFGQEMFQKVYEEDTV